MAAGGPVGVGVGRLRDRVTFKSPVRTAGQTGQQKVTGWTLEYETWGQVEPAVTAREKYGHGQQFATASHAVTLRGRATADEPKPTWQATWKGRTLNVLGTLPGDSGVNSILVVYCQELLPTG